VLRLSGLRFVVCCFVAVEKLPGRIFDVLWEDGKSYPGFIQSVDLVKRTLHVKYGSTSEFEDAKGRPDTRTLVGSRLRLLRTLCEPSLVRKLHDSRQGVP
jgi:hypothetical protein